MAFYNEDLYGAFAYGEVPEKQTTAVTSTVDAISPEVDKWISPFFKRFFPEFWHSEYETFLKFFRYYLETLENEDGSYWTVANLVELATLATTVESNLNNMREQFAPDFRFEDFPNIDSRKFLENAKRFYAIKGNDQSFRFLFRMLGHEIEVFNPLDDTLFVSEHSTIGNEKLIDSFYYNPYTYDIRVDLPYNEWSEFIRRLNHPIGTKMFGTYVVNLGDGVVDIPNINTTIPNTQDQMVTLDGTIENLDTTFETIGDISNFPEPTDPNAVDRLVVRVGSEDILYTTKDDNTNTFTISERAINQTRQEVHSDVGDFTVDINNNYIILSSRLDMFTGKKISISSTGILPTPLLPSTDYYTSVVEIQSLLEGNITPSSTTLVLEDASKFPNSGTLYIRGELLSYTSKTNNTLENLTRGIGNTTANSHVDEDKVYYWDRVVRLSESLNKTLNRDYITVTDEGTGTHTITGPGQEVTLFTGFNILRPQALLVREVNGYTSYNDVEKDIFIERVIDVHYEDSVTRIVNEFTTPSDHPFSVGEQVWFKSPVVGLSTAIDSLETTIPVDSTSEFNASGIIRIENEWISYSGVTATSFTGATRGVLGSIATSHAINSNVTARSFETTGNVEIVGIQRVRRVSINSFELIDNSDITIPIITDASGTFNVVFHDFNGAERWSAGNLVQQASTSSEGTIVWPNNMTPTGRTIYIESTSGNDNWTNSGTVTVDGSTNTGTIDDARVINTQGDYFLNECDFGDLTFDEIENGGNDYAQGLKTLYPLIREETPVNITRRYFVPNMSVDIQTVDSDWITTKEVFANFDPNEQGHISMAGSSFRGLLRGFLAPNRPVIEVDATTDLTTTRISLGRVQGQIGQSSITGSFNPPTTPLNTDTTIEFFDEYYNYLFDNTVVLDLDRNVTVGSIPVGDTIIGEAFASNAIWSGDGSGGTGARRHWRGQKFGYAIGLGPAKKYIRLTLNTNVALSSNWRATNDVSFNANSAGHLTQLISGATGIIRAKNTIQSVLNGSISDGVTTIALQDASQFPNSGQVQIDDELMTYTGKSGNSLTGIVRGTNNTNAALHLDGAVVTTANIPVAEPNTVFVEVISGIFSTEATNTITSGNGTTPGNDTRVVNTIEDRSKGVPKVNQLIYNTPLQSADPNGLDVWQATEVFEDNDETIVVLDHEYTKPTDPSGGNGTANLLNTSKEYD